MIKHKYDAILCDLGNVLIDFDHRIAVKKLLGRTSAEEKDIYMLFFDSGFTKLYEEGKIASKEFFHRIKINLKLDADYATFIAIWNDIFFETRLNIKMQNLLKSVKPKYKLIMISNINKTHLEFLKKKMSIFNKFDKLILSYKVGFRKPAPQIYKEALKAANTIPSRVLYIDDRKDLVEKASKFGINGMVFNGEKAFQSIKKEIIR